MHRPVEFYHLYAGNEDYFHHGGQRYQNLFRYYEKDKSSSKLVDWKFEPLQRIKNCFIIRRESNEITRFWLYPTMQIEKSERSKRGIVASRENGRKFLTLSNQMSRNIRMCMFEQYLLLSLLQG